VWITDGQGKEGKGHQVFKFSPDGKVLMTLGKAAWAATARIHSISPMNVAIAPNGDIFVSDGHTPNMGNARVVKFSKDGKFIMQWGKHGSGPGEFEVPHALAFDSRGGLFVGDRANNRVQDFRSGRQVHRSVEAIRATQRVFIDKNDILYVTDSESTDKQGLRIQPWLEARHPNRQRERRR